MTTPTPKAVEAAAIQPWPKSSSHVIEITGDDGTQLFAILSNGTVRGTIENAGPAARQFMTALRGMTETIAAQAKGEALIAFADAHRMPEPMFMDDGRVVTVGDLLREQAAEYRNTPS